MWAQVKNQYNSLSLSITHESAPKSGPGWCLWPRASCSPFHGSRKAFANCSAQAMGTGWLYVRARSHQQPLGSFRPSVEQEGREGEQCRLFSVVCDAYHAVETSDEIRPVLHDINWVEPYRAFLSYKLAPWPCSCSQLMWLGSLPECWTLTSA